VQRAKGAGIAINLAKRFVSQSPFFLSWSCDFRGRMYDQQAWLGRQKSDFEKALLRFVEGCKLDAKAEQWAAQAVGAAYLGSRGTFLERSQWTYGHAELLEAITDDPIRMASHWEDADEPWQFLQLTIEWTAVVLRKSKPLWQVPVTADSTAPPLANSFQNKAWRSEKSLLLMASIRIRSGKFREDMETRRRNPSCC
jgi:DNA-directed RNA polymerase